MKVKSESEVAQSCPTLRDPKDCSLPGSSIRGIFQARVLGWGAIAFSANSKSRRQKNFTDWRCNANLRQFPLFYLQLWWKGAQRPIKREERSRGEDLKTGGSEALKIVIEIIMLEFD